MSSAALTPLAFGLHITGGTVALLAGTVAVLSAKGARLHRLAGTVFFVSMLVMAAFADYLAVIMPDQVVNFFIGTFTIYLVATAWMTVRREEGTSGFAEKIALLVSLCLCLPFVVLSCQLAAGLPPSVKSAMALKGPVLIAIYSFTALLVLALIGDARMVWAGGITGARRIGRHLWRMCIGLSLAAGSAFTNGLPRLLPHDVHVPLLILFVPQLAVLALLIFWALRVRFTGWYSRAVPTPLI
jgi:uncharacterized membrane protein